MEVYRALPEEEKNRAINNQVQDKVVPKALKTVLKWLHPKDPNITYCDFLFNEILQGKCNSVRHSWFNKWKMYTQCKLLKATNTLDQTECQFADSKYKLDQKDTQNYDSQLLVQIIFCLKEHSENSSLWEDIISKSVIEGRGRALNIIRNGVSHNTNTYQHLVTNINVRGLPSCILYPGEKPENGEEKVFNFSHKSQAEYFSSLAIIKELGRNSGKAFDEVLEIVAGEPISEADLKVK